MLTRYQNLIKKNKKNQSKIEAIRAEGEDVTHLYVYGVIDPWFGVSAAAFAKELNSIDTDEIVIHINSPGGHAFDGKAMAAEIKNHKSVITAQITGLCASAATFIANACDEVHMDSGAFFMIHKAWVFMAGNADDLIKEAEVLGKLDQSMAQDYAKKTGKELSEIQDLMAAESWFSAEEAQDNGFIDQIMDEDDDEEPQSRYNVEAFENAPAQLLAEPGPAGPDEPEVEEPEPDLSKFQLAQAKARAAFVSSR
jgi:ATP-dependent protease ClpP protease subunit